MPLGDVEEAIEAACAGLDLACFEAVARTNAAWGTATGLRDADTIAAFLAAGPASRAAMLEEVLFVVLTKSFEPRKYAAGLLKADPGYPDQCVRLADQIGRLLGWRHRAALAAAIGAGLRAGQAYAQAYAEAKRAAGLVDFDDLIRATVRLLDEPGMGDWVRYKLDQQTDHILVDEAQDTNAAQWAIVGRLAEEFFVGAGARGGRRAPSSPSAISSRRSSASRAPTRSSSSAPGSASRSRRSRSTASSSTCRSTAASARRPPCSNWSTG
ncbi:UvrD-helicase domain-containing protein [Rhizorhabdus histidinilytica]